jgi:hypothetical protein
LRQEVEAYQKCDAKQEQRKHARRLPYLLPT